jgi:hypothetical protein
MKEPKTKEDYQQVLIEACERWAEESLVEFLCDLASSSPAPDGAPHPAGAPLLSTTGQPVGDTEDQQDSGNYAASITPTAQVCRRKPPTDSERQRDSQADRK